MLGSGVSLKPGTTEVYADSACKFEGPKSIVPFAFRTHAHGLGMDVREGKRAQVRVMFIYVGKQIVGYVVKSGKWELIGTRSPQDPQVTVLGTLRRNPFHCG